MINSFRNYALIIVVFIHAHIYLYSYTLIEIPFYLEIFYSKFLGFFHPASILAAISGYLYFKEISVSTFELIPFIKGKYLKRLGAVFIPYFFWITFLFLITNGILFFNQQHVHLTFASKFNSISFSNYLLCFIYPHMASAQHLWYLDNMIIVFAFSPLLIYLNRVKGSFILLIFLICIIYYFIFKNNHKQLTDIIKFRFISFYVLGAYLAMNKNLLGLAVNRKLMISVGCFLILFVEIFIPELTNNYGLMYILNSLIVPIIVFFIAYFLISQYIHPSKVIYNRSNHYLLYIIHPFLLTLICKIVFFDTKFLFNNYFLFFISASVLTYLIIKTNTWIYVLLEKLFPKFCKRIL